MSDNQPRIEPPQEAGTPQRRHTVWAKISADNSEELANEIHRIARYLERGEIEYRCISGSYSSGHIVIHSVDGNMDHEKWAKDLDAWLAERAAEKDSANG